MATHVRILAALHIVFGCLGLLLGLLVFAFFGGLAGFVGMTGRSAEAPFVVPILGAIGGVVLVVALLLAVPGIVAGIGLLGFRPWARIMTLILSGFDLLHVPFGTALGVYGLDRGRFSSEGRM
jgi:hypothetical protein